MVDATFRDISINLTSEASRNLEKSTARTNRLSSLLVEENRDNESKLKRLKERQAKYKELVATKLKLTRLERELAELNSKPDQAIQEQPKQEKIYQTRPVLKEGKWIFEDLELRID